VSIAVKNLNNQKEEKDFAVLSVIENLNLLIK
jgi:hypothetical protein